MNRVTYLFLGLVVFFTLANADDHYLCYTGAGDLLYIARIPGPGIHDGLDVVATFPIVYNSDALTYDGENWWIPYQLEIYCFDKNGDYVRSFPYPYYWDVPGLGWDGQYLWVDCHDIWQLDIYGNPGPYGNFPAPDFAHESLTVNYDAERILCGNWAFSEGVNCFVRVFNYNGDILYDAIDNIGGSGYYDEAAFTSLAYYDGIVWVSYYYYSYTTHELIQEIYGYEYVEGGNWHWLTTVRNMMAWDLAVCDEDFVNIAEASLGKIKAYFADEEEK